MKLLTINTHSLIERDSEKKLKILAQAISEEMPDVVAMQEINQTASLPGKYDNCFVTSSAVKDDNYAASLLENLKKRGIDYSAAWLPIKNGYKKYDEGTAILSRACIEENRQFLISSCSDYKNWKTRRILGIKNCFGWFFSVHMGWWDDAEEPFSMQWERLCSFVPKGERVWLMGDFNCPSDVLDEGYGLICSSGWYDSYTAAQYKDDGFTVEREIDGWRGRKKSKMRIDYIFSNFKARVKSSEVIFNGKNREYISDHCGVIIETEE